MDASQLLESINQNINEGIYRSDKNGLIYVNRAFARMFGYENEEEVLALDSLNLYVNPDVRAELVDKLLRYGSFENEEVRFFKKNGQQFIGLISSCIYKDREGNTFWDGAIRDVTAHREAMMAVQQNDKLLETINTNISEAIYRSVKDKGLIYVNEGFVSMFGFKSAEEIYEGSAWDLYKNPEERDQLGEELETKGAIANREVEFRRKDGSTFWGQMSSIMSDEDGVVYFDGAIRDFTHQKEFDEELKYQAAMQQILINLSSKYINLPVEKMAEAIDSSLEELGTFMNADRAYIFEYRINENLYSNTYEWCREGIAPAIKQCQDLKIDSFPVLVDNHFKGLPVVIPNVLKMADKSARDMLSTQDIKSLISVPMFMDDQCFGFVGFDSVRDYRSYTDNEILLIKVLAEIMVNLISRSTNQKQLQRLVDTTSSQNKRLKDFSYITSHNFRASVANLVSLTDILEEDPGNPQYLEMIKITTNKLSEVINNINELLNFENEVFDLKREECFIFKTIEGVLKLNNRTLSENNIEVELDVDKDLKVNAFSVYLESIFHNVITNAIKYGTKEGSKKIKILAERTNSEIVVMIQDYGLGIDLKKYGNKLFKLGARFHSKKWKGQGLGLFMTKHQIEAMDGRIEVESKVNQGSTFKLYFNGK